MYIKRQSRIAMFVGNYEIVTVMELVNSEKKDRSVSRLQ